MQTSDGKSYNGLIRMLLDGDIDLSTAGLAQTKDRTEAVDFLFPLDENVATLVAPENQGEVT